MRRTLKGPPRFTEETGSPVRISTLLRDFRASARALERVDEPSLKLYTAASFISSGRELPSS